jgi:hypothetical protein
MNWCLAHAVVNILDGSAMRMAFLEDVAFEHSAALLSFSGKFVLLIFIATGIYAHN